MGLSSRNQRILEQAANVIRVICIAHHYCHIYKIKENEFGKDRGITGEE